MPTARAEVPPRRLGLVNAQIAAALDEIADLLEIGGANPFRVRAYRRAVRGFGEKLEHEILQATQARPNSQPDRLDLVDTACQMARSEGVLAFPPPGLQVRIHPPLQARAFTRSVAAPFRARGSSGTLPAP